MAAGEKPKSRAKNNAERAEIGAVRKGRSGTGKSRRVVPAAVDKSRSRAAVPCSDRSGQSGVASKSRSVAVLAKGRKNGKGDKARHKEGTSSGKRAKGVGSNSARRALLGSSASMAAHAVTVRMRAGRTRVRAGRARMRASREAESCCCIAAIAFGSRARMRAGRTRMRAGRTRMRARSDAYARRSDRTVVI